MDHMKQFRIKKKLTQRQVAVALGVGQSAVAMWETGKSLPRADKLTDLARLYGCSVDELLQDNLHEKGA